MDYERRGRNSHGGREGASRYRDSSRDAEGNEGARENNNDESRSMNGWKAWGERG